MSDFDAFIWQSEKGNLSPENPRSGMIEALEKHHIQIGMERKKIRKLLGQPDDIIDQTDIYDIGVSPFGIDFETYQIDYKGEVAIKFYISRG